MGWAKLRGAAEYEFARGQALVLWGAEFTVAGAGAAGLSSRLRPVQTDKTKEVDGEMNKEFRGLLGDKPLSAEELEKIQANETLSLPGSRRRLRKWGNRSWTWFILACRMITTRRLRRKVRALKTSDPERCGEGGGASGQYDLGGGRRPRED